MKCGQVTRRKKRPAPDASESYSPCSFEVIEVKSAGPLRVAGLRLDTQRRRTIAERRMKGSRSAARAEQGSKTHADSEFSSNLLKRQAGMRTGHPHHPNFWIRLQISKAA
jgi:hypothetical protein